MSVYVYVCMCVCAHLLVIKIMNVHKYRFFRKKINVIFNIMISTRIKYFWTTIVLLNCPPKSFCQDIFSHECNYQFLIGIVVETLCMSGITCTMATLSFHRNRHRKNVESTHEIQQILIETRHTTCNYITNYNYHVSKV